MKKIVLIILMLVACSTFFVSPTLAQDGGISIPETGLPDPSGGIGTILAGVLNWLLGILGFLGIIGFTVSGIMYLISTGDDTMIKRAKNGMLYSIIGIVVGLAGVVLIRTIDELLGGGQGGEDTEYTDNTGEDWWSDQPESSGTDNTGEDWWSDPPASDPDTDGIPPGTTVEP